MPFQPQHAPCRAAALAMVVVSLALVALVTLNVACASSRSTTTIKQSTRTSEPTMERPGEMESDYQMESPGTMIVE